MRGLAVLAATAALLVAAVPPSAAEPFSDCNLPTYLTSRPAHPRPPRAATLDIATPQLAGPRVLTTPDGVRIELLARTETADTIRVTQPATADAPVGGTVPATLSLQLGANASFGAIAPGVERDYRATSAATVTSKAGDAKLSVSPPGHLANGAFTLPEPLRVDLNPPGRAGARPTRLSPAASRDRSARSGSRACAARSP